MQNVRTGPIPDTNRQLPSLRAALPQRMEYLIPEEAVKEEQVAEVMPTKFANQETVENIGQRIRQ